MTTVHSIRSRLTRGAILAAGLVITAGSLAAYHLTKRDFLRQIDIALAARANVIEGKSGVFFGRPILWGKTGEFGQPPPPDQYEIYGSFHLTHTDGQVVASFSEGEGSPPIVAGQHPAIDKPYTTRLPDGTPVRAIATTYSVEGNLNDRSRRDRNRDRDRDAERPPPERVTYQLDLTTIRDLTPTHNSLANLRIVLASAGIGTFLALALSINWIVSRSLAPVSKIASELEGRDATTLDSPLASDLAVPAELSPLVASFNTLLARIHESLDRERRFASNAAHELRTPLAALTARLENATRNPRDNATYLEAIEKSLANTRAMNTLVERLLSLARFDSASFQTELADATLADLTALSAESFEPLTQQRKITLHNNIPPELTLNTDPALLQVVTDNLIENALTYADPGTAVTLAAERTPGHIALTISNPCSAITSDDATHVFDPFWRGDAARTGTTLHAGLGLSICQKITTLLGGTITATAQDGTFQITLTLPSSPS